MNDAFIAETTNVYWMLFLTRTLIDIGMGVRVVRGEGRFWIYYV